MTDIQLDDYGRVFKCYAGQGEITDSDGEVHPLTVQVAVTHDAKIVCIFEGPVSPDLLFEPPTPTLTAVAGQQVHTRDLRQVFSQSTVGMGTEHVSTCQIVCLATDLLIGTRDNAPQEIRYFVSNLKIFRPLELQLSDHSVRLEPLPGYSQEIRLLAAHRGTAVTCVLRVSRLDGQPLDISLADSMISDVCMLLSLARGTTVNWITSEWIIRDAQYSYHRNMLVSAYGSLHVIPYSPPQDLGTFMQTCYGPYQGAKSTWSLLHVIQHFVTGVQSTDYLELRALKLTTLLDYVRGRFAEAFDDGGNLIDQNVFNTRKKAVQKGLKVVLRDVFSDYPESVTGEMSQHVAGFFRRSFKDSLERMLRHLGLGVEAEELSRFVAIRNRVVHDAAFLPRDKHGSSWQQYSTVLSLVSRVLLAILHYEGYYYDWAKHVPDEWDGPESTGRTRLQLDRSHQAAQGRDSQHVVGESDRHHA